MVRLKRAGGRIFENFAPAIFLAGALIVNKTHFKHIY